VVTKKKAPAKKVANKPVAKITAKKTVNPVGRPASYKPEYAEQAYKFCLLGAGNDKLAQLFGVAGSTLDKWIAEIPEFSGKVMEGREVADAEIANSLFHRAKGYSHAEDDIRTLSIGGGMSEIVITPTIKHYPPDTGAATLWLKNRQPTIWRDKVEVEQRTTIVDMTDEQLDAKLAQLTDARSKD
jgi:hypothetical protein